MADSLTCRLLRLIDCLSMLYEILVGEGPWERTVVVLNDVRGKGLQEDFLKTRLFKSEDKDKDSKDHAAYCCIKCNVKHGLQSFNIPAYPNKNSNYRTEALLTSNRIASEGAYYDAVQTALLYRSLCCEKDGRRRTGKVCDGLWELLILRIYRALTVWGKVSPINFDDFKDFIEKYVCSFPELSNADIGDRTWMFKVLHFLWPDTYPAVDDKIANNLLRNIAKNIASELGYNPDRVKKLDALLILVEIIRKLKGGVSDMDPNKGCSDSFNSYLTNVYTPKTFVKKFEQALWVALWLRSPKIGFIDNEFIKSFIGSRCGVRACGPSVKIEACTRALYDNLVDMLVELIKSDDELRRLADEVFRSGR